MRLSNLFLKFFGLFNWVGLEVKTVKWGYCMVWKSKERSISSLVCLFQEVNNMLGVETKKLYKFEN